MVVVFSASSHLTLPMQTAPLFASAKQTMSNMDYYIIQSKRSSRLQTKR